jgi:hypothetical protein
MRSYLLLLLLFFISSVVKGQTLEDVNKLGLTETQLSISFEKRELLLSHRTSAQKK